MDWKWDVKVVKTTLNPFIKTQQKSRFSEILHSGTVSLEIFQIWRKK